MPTTQEKELSLKTAIEITKEYARGGGSGLYSILQNLYDKLNELKDDVIKED